MGQCANLIIVENNERELYYDHWCANSLDSDLFWGIDKAVQFFRDHEQQEDDCWLDTTWCEGGAVIDLDKKVLLWFGGEDICYDIPLRRAFLELMNKTWPRFQIHWAYAGIVDLADYVGYDRNKVIVPFDEEELFDTEKIIDVFDSIGSDDWNIVISFRNMNNEIEVQKKFKKGLDKETKKRFNPSRNSSRHDPLGGLRQVNMQRFSCTTFL
ncbi:MAG: hypothetical protein FWG14_00550 [Peptococcaceae bacterium]|nr:hypothetical protein [Peptococcaceae bacterium]